MLEYNRKINVSKYFLLSVLIICLIFTAFGIGIENSHAGDLNESNQCEDLELKVESQLENGQMNYDNVIKVSSDDCESSDKNYSKSDNNDQDLLLESSNEDSEILGVKRTLTDGTFRDIQKLVNSSKKGDTIVLNGRFYHDGSIDWIRVTKQLTITSESGAVLDGLNRYQILGIYANAAGSIVKNIRFENANGAWGSALRISGKNMVVEDCEFVNNHHNQGGALSTVYDIDKCENLIVRRCTFIGNNGYQDNPQNLSNAGALGAYSRNAQIIDCTFDSNWVKSDVGTFGGALRIGMDYEDSKGFVSGCTFINNRAYANTATSHGGACCVRNGVDFENCIFINNAADEGGAITMHASGNIVGCTFINNTAERLYGGAISSGFLFDSMILNIKNCNFEGNHAPEGGAVQAGGLNVLFDNSNFKNNHATGCGGAITIQASNVLINNLYFEDNVAEVNGGAVYLRGNDTKISNSRFISNDALPDSNKLNDGLGGAIYVDSPKAEILSNEFKYNTARNGSAIYYEKTGENLYLNGNILFENQAWVYGLPIYAEDIYFEDTQRIKVVIYGGNNIAEYDNLAVSNAIYNAANFDEISIDNQKPVFGATTSGQLYQDNREYNIGIVLTVWHEDGTVIYNNSLNSSYLGEISVDLENLKPGKYYVASKHAEDTYYKEIENTTSFRVIPKVDNQITIISDKQVYDFEDMVKWTINITNNGPNNATEVIINNLLPEGLIYYMDDSGGVYNNKTGQWNVSTLNVGEKKSFNMITVIDKTGVIINSVNITSYEIDTDLTNNRDEHSITVNPSADLVVLKTVNNTHPKYHDIVNWTVTIKNNGPDICHNITLQDVIPHSLILVNSTGGFDFKRRTFEIESLEVGKEIVFNIITKIATTGIIENTAEAYGAEFDYDLSNNKNTETVLVDLASDLSILKTVNASEVNYLDRVKWILTISNNGPDNASDVKVVDVLPKGFRYVNSTLNYTENEINVGNLSVGQTMVIEIVCDVYVTGNYTNIANITSSNYDWNLSNNEDSQPITVNPASDLEIEKFVDETEPEFADSVQWTITVVNYGPDIAHNVTVCEVLPDSLIYIEDDSEGSYNPKTGKWIIDTLNVYDSATLVIETKVNKTGVLTNNVNVTSNEYDYYLDNNHNNESVEVEPSADLSISKTVDNTSPNYYDYVRWIVSVSNKGPDNATNINITEKIPDGLILIDVATSKGTYSQDVWSIDLLENGETQTLELFCKVNKTGNITNIVVVSGEEYDPNSTNNEDNETISVPLAVDIEVIVDVNNQNPLFGEEIILMIEIKNNGPDNGTGVVLTDILPDSLIYLNHTSTKGNYGEGLWNVSSLNVGEVQYLNITCITDEIGIIINEAQAISEEYDWNLENNYDDTSVNVLPVTDLSIEKIVDNPTPNYNDIITWTLTVSNNGPNDAENVVVCDKLSDKLEFIISSDDENYDGEKWYVGDLKNGEVKQLSITSKVKSTGLIQNHANVTGEFFDPNLDNNHADELVNVNPASDLAVTKITSKNHYVVGDMVRYTITVVNNGPDTAYNVKVSEILDKSLVLKSFKATKGKFDKNNQIWEIDYLENGESAVLIINVLAVGSGIINNAVTVTSDSFDYDLSNNNASCSINVTEKSDNHSSSLKNNNKYHKGIIHETGNPILIFIVSLMFFITFSGVNIFKKR